MDSWVIKKGTAMSASEEKLSAVEAANARFFDDVSRDARYRSEAGQFVTKQVSNAVIDILKPFLKEGETDLLDFACGPGHITLNLLPYVKTVTGADVSEESVKAFNERVKEMGTVAKGSGALHVRNGELPQDSSYDIITCIHSYHHFENPGEITWKLSKHLKSGGVLLIVDFLIDDHIESDKKESYVNPHTKHFSDKHHDVKSMIPHRHGFEVDEIKGMLEPNLTDISINTSFALSRQEIKGKEGGQKIFGGLLEDKERGDALRYIRAIGRKA